MMEEERLNLWDKKASLISSTSVLKESPVSSMMTVQERDLLKCYDLSFVITCSLSSKICAKEYPEKCHSKEAGDKLWQWTLRCYATLCSVYSCPVELPQRSSRVIFCTDGTREDTTASHLLVND